jgi:O-antigen/teichoic acid export membrane protein
MLSLIRKNNQIIIGLINQSFNIIVPFIITFLSLKILTPEQGSIWLMFLSMIILIGLFDFGLSPTIVRNVSYVIAKAKRLPKDKLENIDFGDSISFSLLNRLISDVRLIYRKLTILASLIILGCGSIYFYYIAPKDITTQVCLSWLLFGCGLLVSLYYLYYTPILSGFGKIQHANLANIYGRVSWLAMTAILLPSGLNLLKLSFAFFFSVIITRVICVYFYNNNNFSKATLNVEPVEESTIPFISGNAIRLGMATMGNVIISRAPVIIAGIGLNLSVAGSFTFTTQIYLAILSISNVYIAIQVPKLAHLFIKKESKEIKKIILRTVFLTNVLYLISFVLFVLLSNFIIEITEAKVGFLELKYVLLMGGIFLLDLNHNLCTCILATANRIPFVRPTIISGVLIAVIGWILVVPFHMGIIGLIATQGIVQLCYNNWKWPLLIYQEYF